MENKKENPVFIGGVPRSGTSIMAFTMGSHEDFVSYLEPHGFYNYFLKYYMTYPIPEKLFKYIYLKKLSQVMPYSLSGQKDKHDEEKVRKHFSKEYLENSYDECFKDCKNKKEQLEKFNCFAEKIFGEFCEKENKKRWSVKQPDYFFLAVDKIYSIHPDMKFINMVRDGRDTISSIMNVLDANYSRNIFLNIIFSFVDSFSKVKLFRKKRFKYAFQVWQEILLMGYEKTKKIPSENIITVKVEELTGDRDNEMKRICDFLEIDYSGKIKEYAEKNIKETNYGRWKTELTEEEVNYIETEGKEILERYGYI